MVQKVIIVKDSSEQSPVPLNIDSSGNLGTTSTGSTVTVGQVTCTANAGTAVILGTHAAKQVWVQAPATNTVPVLIGGSTSTCTISLAAGGPPYYFPISNANLLFCKSSTASATEVINWMAIA